MDTSDPRAALDALIRAHGSDYSSLSRLLGRNPAYVQQYVKRGSPRRLDADDRRVLARFFGVAESVLGAPAAVAKAGPAMVAVPQLALAASAGPGAWVDDEKVTGRIGFAADWLRHRGASGTGLLGLLRVAGDSMTPTLADGDEILVDRGDAAGRLRDGVYVLRLGNELIVKRLLVEASTGRFSVQSDNPAALLPAGVETAEVVGRVLWFGRPL